MTNPGNGTARLRTGLILIYLIGTTLAGSAAAKFALVPKVVLQMSTIGFDGPRLILIAVLEIASAFLFLIPRTRALGLLLVSAYLGGAIAAHLGHGQPAESASPTVLLALFWIGAWLRHPEALWSVRKPELPTGIWRTIPSDS